MLSLYISSPTWLHRTPVTLKLITLALTSILLVPASRFAWPLGVCVVLMMGFLSIGAPGRRRLIWLIKTVGALVLVIGVIQFLFLLQEDGLETAGHRALISALRLLGLLLLADLVSVTTPMADMLRAIRWLLAPLQVVGLSTKKLELSIGLMIRMVILLNQRREVVTQMMKVRTKKRVGIRMTAPLVRQLVLQTRQQADALHTRKLRQAPTGSN